LGSRLDQRENERIFRQNVLLRANNLLFTPPFAHLRAHEPVWEMFSLPFVKDSFYAAEKSSAEMICSIIARERTFLMSSHEAQQRENKDIWAALSWALFCESERESVETDKME
jgi:hypothetical protein